MYYDLPHYFLWKKKKKISELTSDWSTTQRCRYAFNYTNNKHKRENHLANHSDLTAIMATSISVSIYPHLYIVFPFQPIWPK